MSFVFNLRFLCLSYLQPLQIALSCGIFLSLCAINKASDCSDISLNLFWQPQWQVQVLILN